MKRIILLLIVLFSVQFLFAQSPQGFNYQAIIRDSNGDIISEQDVALKINILQSSTSGELVYSEEHQEQTNSNGLVNLTIGDGEIISGKFSSIPWDNGPFYVQLEVDIEGGTDYTEMGTTQLLSVPYALYSEETENVTHYGSDTLFVVKDKQGKPVFAVFPDGAKVYVNSTSSKGKVGGFAVSGRSTAKGEYPIFTANSDSTKVYVDQSSKGKVGGFAVSGRSTAKGEYPILTTNSDSTRVYVDQSSKGKVGGFAVSGRSTAKQYDVTSFLDLTPENYFIGHGAGANVTPSASLDSGQYNAFIGYQAGQATTTGYQNVFLGYKAGLENTEGRSNVFIGQRAGESNFGEEDINSGNDNIFIGDRSGLNNTEGQSNVFVGTSTGHDIKTSSFNVFVGNNAGLNAGDAQEEVLCSFNTIIGNNAAAQAHALKSGNVFVGLRSGYEAGGGQNVYIGERAGYNGNGSNNVFLGYKAGRDQSGSNKLIVENSSADSTQSLIYGEFDNDVLTFNANVGIDTTNPGYPLHVAGDAMITGELYYDSSPADSIYKPDFVFSKDYTENYGILEIEQFINENKHLPWVTPSGKEKEGINLTRMTFETLEATENIQKQVIGLKKENKQLKQISRKQRKQLKQITKTLNKVTEKNERLEEENRKLKQKIDKVEELEERNEQLENEIDKIKDLLKDSK